MLKIDTIKEKTEVLDREEFLEALQEKVRQIGYAESKSRKIEFRRVGRGNGRYAHSCIMYSTDGEVASGVCMEPYYDLYKDGTTIEESAERVLARCRIKSGIEAYVRAVCEDYTQAAGHLAVRIMNYEKNKTDLQNRPHRRFLDLAVVTYLYFPEEEGSGDPAAAGYVNVTYEMLRYWQQSEEKLFEDAEANSPRILPVKMASICEMLGMKEEEEQPPIYVLTNESGVLGAGVCIYPELLPGVADLLRSDLILLPSSVHEVLVLPDDGSADTFTLAQIVKGINETQVAPEEVLSDSVYRFCRKSGTLQLCQAAL